MMTSRVNVGNQPTAGFGFEEGRVATLFFSYSHFDENLRDQLETHLSGLRRRVLRLSYRLKRTAIETL
jgi:hypothetical protein